MATCYQGHVFDTQEPVVIRTCDHMTGHWQEGDFLPVCSDRCETSLLTGPASDILKPDITVSTEDTGVDQITPLSQRVLLTNRTYWSPASNDLSQFVQSLGRYPYELTTQFCLTVVPLPPSIQLFESHLSQV
ncbi:hypothetical protein PoB_002038900 [Plakobranchus ocellatus]|uniref:Sushi domain-containing protein n=1 Tax=Plakobranchus ocellatus TaxID=259542 RepID=A0AAV3ZET4_9GAST|nr:hypothetical protein PoB_002038900 [Plakobranchus ocellatus]